MKTMTVFTFKINHLDFNGNIIDHYEKQERFVLAETEEEAIEKMEKYRNDMINKGYANFTYQFSPTVEIENVIV